MTTRKEDLRLEVLGGGLVRVAICRELTSMEEARRFIHLVLFDEPSKPPAPVPSRPAALPLPWNTSFGQQLYYTRRSGKEFAVFATFFLILGALFIAAIMKF